MYGITSPLLVIIISEPGPKLFDSIYFALNPEENLIVSPLITTGINSTLGINVLYLLGFQIISLTTALWPLLTLNAKEYLGLPVVFLKYF